MLSNRICDLVTNEVAYVPDGFSYTAILGANPSAGARSPRLWNAAYDNLGIPCKMVALDVQVENLAHLLATLQSDERFLGGCVAVPYKEAVFRWLNGRVDEHTFICGAVNSIFRVRSNLIFGSNTDGVGAIESLESLVGQLYDETVLILGFGGTAKSIVSYLSCCRPSMSITVACRNEPTEALMAGKFTYVQWGDLDSLVELRQFDLVINATSIGYGNQDHFSPLTQKMIKNLTNTRLVFDVVYQPAETTLLRMCKSSCATLNGLEMNYRQAIRAFHNTHGRRSEGREILDLQSVEEAMLSQLK